jgi:hypothetical protein
LESADEEKDSSNPNENTALADLINLKEKINPDAKKLGRPLTNEERKIERVGIDMIGSIEKPEKFIEHHKQFVEEKGSTYS